MALSLSLYTHVDFIFGQGGQGNFAGRYFIREDSHLLL